MHRDHFDDNDPRPTSLRQYVFQVIARASQPMAPADVAARLPLDLQSIYTAMKSLRRAGILRYVAGSSRLHEIAPGAAMPADNRGKAPGSRAAIVRIAKMRRASRPISQFTAGRLRPRALR